MNRSYVFYECGVLDTLNATSKIVSCRDFRHIALDLIVNGSANLTFKVYGANGDIAPNLSVAPSSTNRYFPVQITDRNNGTNITGATGVVYSGSSDGGQSYEVNTDGLDWVCVKVTARTAGFIDLNFHLYDNE